MKNSYSFFDLIYLSLCVVRAKFISSNIRLIRFPVSIRGREYIQFGRRFTIGTGCRLEAFATTPQKKIVFGDNVQINDYVHITSMEQVFVGDNVLMASKIYISDCSHGDYSSTIQSDPNIAPYLREYLIKPVIIEDNVWIGESVSVLPGSKIGKGSIIGANSVVKGEIPPFSIAVGSPARVVKIYDFYKEKWIKV